MINMIIHQMILLNLEEIDFIGNVLNEYMKGGGNEKENLLINRLN